MTLKVLARPASFSTANERVWKDAVRAAVYAQHFTRPTDARFAVAIEFRVAVAKTANEVWDLDNLTAVERNVRSCRATQLPRMPLFTPRVRATWVMGLPNPFAIRTHRSELRIGVPPCQRHPALLRAGAYTIRGEGPHPRFGLPAGD